MIDFPTPRIRPSLYRLPHVTPYFSVVSAHAWALVAQGFVLHRILGSSMKLSNRGLMLQFQSPGGQHPTARRGLGLVSGQSALGFEQRRGGTRTLDGQGSAARRELTIFSSIIIVVRWYSAPESLRHAAPLQAEILCV